METKTINLNRKEGNESVPRDYHWHNCEQCGASQTTPSSECDNCCEEPNMEGW